MSFVMNLVLVAQILSALGMVGLILVQHGKGADMGAAFGSGSSGSLFGASGSANFLSRSTAIAATVFFCCCLALSIISSKQGSGNKLGLDAPAAAQHHAPAASQPATASQPVIPE